MSTGNMSRAQLATLASEIEQAMPTPEWDSVPELRKFKQEITDVISKDDKVRKNGGKAKLSFDQLVVRYKELDGEVKLREVIKADIKEALDTAMAVADCTECECEGYPVQRITKQGSRRVSPERLLGAGVSADTIARCTEVGAEISYVHIGKPKKDR